MQLLFCVSYSYELLINLSFSSLFWHLTESVLFIAKELEQVFVIFPESVSVGDSDKGNTLTLHVGVQMTFNINTNCRSALIQNSISRFVIDESSHSDSLLFTTTQDIIPIISRAPATFSSDKVSKSDFIKNML